MVSKAGIAQCGSRLRAADFALCRPPRKVRRAESLSSLSHPRRELERHGAPRMAASDGRDGTSRGPIDPNALNPDAPASLRMKRAPLVICSILLN